MTAMVPDIYSMASGSILHSTQISNLEGLNTGLRKTWETLAIFLHIHLLLLVDLLVFTLLKKTMLLYTPIAATTTNNTATFGTDGQHSRFPFPWALR